MSVVENDIMMDLVAAELLELSHRQGSRGLLDDNGEWRDEAVALVQLVEAYRQGADLNLEAYKDVTGFRAEPWDNTTERGLKALYFAQGWQAHRLLITDPVTLDPSLFMRTCKASE